MTTRRGFLGQVLALAAAPAIVRASSLMPVAPRIWTPPDPSGEVGSIDGFRFIESPMVPGVLTLEMLRRAAQSLKQRRFDGEWVTIHPGWYDELRRPG